MFEVKFVPQPKQVQKVEDGKMAVDEKGEPVWLEQAPDYTGHVKCRVPKNTDRMDLLTEVAFDFDEKGNLKVADGKNIARLNRLWVDFALKHILSVDLVRTADGVKVPTVEFLEYDAAGAPLLIQCGQFLAKGVTLGNS